MTVINPSAEALFSFIEAELKSGKPFPSHSAMKERIGQNYATAILHLVLSKRLVREKSSHPRQKYTYRLPDQRQGDISDAATSADRGDGQVGH